jgi:geranylgeranylglyceryl phosphate synthase family protein
MSDTVLNHIQNAHSVGKKLFAVLIDPEKCSGDSLLNFISLINKAKPDFIFVGGSQLRHSIDEAVIVIKEHSSIPVVLFIGNAVQFSPNADAMLVLSLISGRNPDFLIGQHVECAIEIKKSGIEAIPTGYVLVGRGQRTAVETVSGTDALSDTETIVRTAIAGELLGQRLIYLEAGSGAQSPVYDGVIAAVRDNVATPLIVGGGIRSTSMIDKALVAGADLIVVGNHLENTPSDIVPFVETVRRHNAANLS